MMGCIRTSVANQLEGCPDCEGILNWLYRGQDQFGKIRVLHCSDCGWSDEWDGDEDGVQPQLRCGDEKGH